MKALSNHVIRDHVIIGGIAAWLATPILGTSGSLAFWVATVMVDIDHYFNFLWRAKFRVFGISPMFRYHEQLFEKRHRPEFLAIEVFHTIEFIFLFGWTALYFKGPLLGAFWGIVFHMLVDFVHLGRYGILTKRSISFVEYYWRRAKMKAGGKNPALPFQEAMREAGIL